MAFVHVRSAVDEYLSLPHVAGLCDGSASLTRDLHDDDWMLCTGIAVLYAPDECARSPLLVAVALSDDPSVDLRTCVKWERILDSYATVCDGHDLDIVLGVRRS
jgi:hypothetical protein